VDVEAGKWCACLGHANVTEVRGVETTAERSKPHVSHAAPQVEEQVDQAGRIRPERTLLDQRQNVGPGRPADVLYFLGLQGEAGRVDSGQTTTTRWYSPGRKLAAGSPPSTLRWTVRPVGMPLGSSTSQNSPLRAVAASAWEIAMMPLFLVTSVA